MVLAALAALAALAFGPTPAVAAAAAELQPSVELGRKTYVTSCTRCHGINLVTSSSAHFDLRTFPRDDKPRFTRSVMQGVRAMPAWGSVLKPVQLESLWLYVGSVNGWTAPAGESSAGAVPGPTAQGAPAATQ